MCKVYDLEDRTLKFSKDIIKLCKKIYYLQLSLKLFNH